MRRTPGEFEDEARDAARRGDYAEAARLYEQAAGASLGHNRADRYKAAANECRKLAGVVR